MRPYAGIEQTKRVTFGVDESRRRLHRLLYCERQLVRAHAAWVIITANWEAKQALARHMWEDAEHMWSLYERAQQLRGNGATLSRSPDPLLTDALSEVLYAPDEVSYLAGVYWVMKPALIRAYTQHKGETHGLVDQPTVRAIRHILIEEEEQPALFADFLAAQGAHPDHRQQIEAWCRHLETWLVAAGGILGTMPRAPTLPEQRADAPFTLPNKPGRDPRFTEVLEPKGQLEERERAGRLRWMMRVRMYEMGAVEHPASVLFERDDMPLEFYRDLARHAWDECRHSMFGQAAIEADGGSLRDFSAFIGDYVWSMRYSPAERYAWLGIAIENGAMKYPPGKRAEYEFCRDEARHPLMALFQDFDWADEVTHAQLGRKWTPTLMDRNATLKDARELAQRLAEEFRQYVATWNARGFTW